MNQTLQTPPALTLSEELSAGPARRRIVDTEALRGARAGFVDRFSRRPYYFVRAATPQVLMDEVDRVL